MKDMFKKNLFRYMAVGLDEKAAFEP